MTKVGGEKQVRQEKKSLALLHGLPPFFWEKRVPNVEI